MGEADYFQSLRPIDRPPQYDSGDEIDFIPVLRVTPISSEPFGDSVIFPMDVTELVSLEDGVISPWSPSP